MKEEEMIRLVLLAVFVFFIYKFFVQGKGLDMIPISMPPSIPDLLPSQIVKLNPQPPKPKPSPPPSKPSGGGGSVVEVHFVFAEWCGHSQTAIPDFAKLVKDSSVKTSSGVPVKFIMTEESSPGMKQFAQMIDGFPTYIYVKKQNGNVVKMEELQVQSRSAQDIKAAAMKL
jgi:thiol-disulfide isomerase/thioredoxin